MFTILIYPYMAVAQDMGKVDSLRKELNKATDLHKKVMLYAYLAREFTSHNVDSTYHYSGPGIRLAEQIGYDSALVSLYLHRYVTSRRLGDMNEAIQNLKLADRTAHDHEVTTLYGTIYGAYALISELQDDLADQLEYTLKEVDAYETYGN